MQKSHTTNTQPTFKGHIAVTHKQQHLRQRLTNNDITRPETTCNDRGPTGGVIPPRPFSPTPIISVVENQQVKNGYTLAQSLTRCRVAEWVGYVWWFS